MRRVVFYTAGWIGLGLALLALFIPLIPATPFLLLAAYGFSRSSKKFHDRILALPKIGRLVQDWENHRILSRDSKILFTSTILPLVIISSIASNFLIYRIAFTTIGAALLTFIWSRKESSSPRPGPNNDLTKIIGTSA